MAVTIARLRMPLAWLSVVLLVVGPFVGLPLWLVFGVFALALAVYFRVGTVRRPPVEVALPLFVAEATVREASGPGGILGNHLVMDLGDGVYAVLAHQRGAGQQAPVPRPRPLTAALSPARTRPGGAAGL